MDRSLFGSAAWKSALDKYAEATGLAVQLFDADGRMVLESEHFALVALFREHGYEPGLFAECARRAVAQTTDRPAVIVAESRYGLLVVGTSLLLDGAIVGAAVAGYALASFPQEAGLQHWAKSIGVPSDRLWIVARQQAPLPERRLMLYGELLQVLGDGLLREHQRTLQYEDAIEQLKTAAAAKDEFLAVLSHELRTPLAPIAGWASILKKSDDIGQIRKAADAIERNAFIESRMVDDLLDVSRIVSGSLSLELATVELSALVRAAAETVAAEIDTKRIRLALADAGEPLFVEGDAGRLAQIFRNILSNAVKFTPPGGSIRVTLTREADHARVVVADTGSGIVAEFLPFVFDMFLQQERGMRRQHEGLGIGLALVKRLVELHNGTVNVASAGAQRGTEVTVRLVLAAEAPDRSDRPAGDEVSASSLAGISILVVDDLQDVRDMLRLLLEYAGANVSVAGSGREALDMVEGVGPDIVLCDLRMPQMDGYEFIRELHRAARAEPPPVVAVSALASDTDRQRARDAGFAWHVKKPFDMPVIITAVHAALGRQRSDSDRPADQE